MARDITSGFATELGNSNLNLIRLVKAEFDGGDLLLHSALRPLTFNAETYQGAGSLLNISDVEETQELRATGSVYELSGVPASLISTALGENYQGRAITSWFGLRNNSGEILHSHKDFSGKMDVMEIEDDGSTSRLAVSAESDAIDLRDSRERRYTPEDQKIEHPNDEGLDFVPKIQDRTITWGAGRKD